MERQRTTKLKKNQILDFLLKPEHTIHTKISPSQLIFFFAELLIISFKQQTACASEL